jgi:dihydroflavonol-4-reductase
MNTDLITGASGLLGGNLARMLVARGRGVRVLLRKNSRTFHIDDLPLERVSGDITHMRALIAAMQGVDTVYHCAARVTVSRTMTPAVWDANVTGTEYVLRAAVAAGVRRVVHCSSVDALGLPQPGKGGASDVTARWNWPDLGLENAYARTKYEAQRIVLEAAQRGQDVVVVCPTFMFGAYDPHPSSGAMILAAARNPFLLALPGGNNFVDVEDVAEGMISAAVSGCPGQVYILGNENMTYTEVFSRISSVLGRRVPRLAVPYAVARLAGWGGDLSQRVTGKETEINTSVAKLGFVDHYFDPSKAVRELGLRRRPLEGALHRAVDWFRQVGML